MIPGARKPDAGIGLIFVGMGIDFVAVCLLVIFAPGYAIPTGMNELLIFYGSNETIAGLLSLSILVLLLCSLRALVRPFPINLIAILISAPVAYYFITLNSAAYAIGPIISLIGGLVGLIQTQRP